MSLEAECGWTLLRAITISLVAIPLVTILARPLQLDSPRHHRRRLLAWRASCEPTYLRWSIRAQW